MNPVFLRSDHYKNILTQLNSYSIHRVPILLLGNAGSRMNLFVEESMDEIKESFSKIDCSLYLNRDIFQKEWNRALDERTILLFSLDKMSKDIQAFLNRELIQLKEKRELPWVIGTSNRDIRELVSKKYFLEELYFRIAVVSIELLAISKRKKDLLVLSQYFLEKYNATYRKRLKYFDPKVSEFLQKFDFPGDLDQLESTIEAMVITGKGRTLYVENLPATIYADSTIHSARKLQIVPGVTLAEYEKAIIEQNLRLHHGNREKTAEALDISVRTLYRKLDEYCLKDLNF